MKPHKHQIETIAFLLKHEKAFCFSSPGTGKTACVIWAILVLLKRRLIKKILIICPKSCVKDVWVLEFFKLYPQLHVIPLVGSKEARIAKLKTGKNIFVINHDGIKSIHDELMKFKFDLIVIDESTAYKHHTSARSKMARKLAAPTDYAWLLTGTPAAQTPTEYYGQALFVCPENVGRSFNRFKDRVLQRISMYKWAPRHDVDEIIGKIIQPAIRYKREDCADLPPVTYIDRHCDFSSQQLKAFEELRKKCVTLVNTVEITAVHAGAMRSKLLQCCCGAIYNKDKEILNVNPEHRLEALYDLITESEQSTLVFADFISAVDTIDNFLTKRKVNHAIIRSKDTSQTRSNIFNAFQKNEIKVLVAHPKIMGHGITLTCADTVIWYCVTSDNELYEQANARINRLGQTNKMRVVHLYTTNFELKILKCLEDKQSVQQLLLDYFADKTKDAL